MLVASVSGFDPVFVALSGLSLVKCSGVSWTGHL
jgi:hypothetical protein